MFPFDLDVAEPDDLTLLAAYLEAEAVADKTRKAEEAAAAKLAAEQKATTVDTGDAESRSDERPGHSNILQTKSDSDSDEESDDADASDDSPAKIRRYTWVERIDECGVIPGERMAPIHGRLIAYGYLNFQLQGREDGVLYRVTTAGRKLLAKATINDVPANEAA